MQIKTAQQHIASIEDRTVTGIFAVHGNVDLGGDRSHVGAFRKTFAERNKQFRFLWNHDFSAPPIATIDEVKEINRDELPSSVLSLAPSATGGALVKRTYLDTPRGDEVLAGIKAGAITEMSYGYDAITWDMSEDCSVKVRELREVRLYDISDVLWGMNPATSAVKFGAPLEYIVAQLKSLAEKAGARHSATDIDLINQIAEAAIRLGAQNFQPAAQQSQDQENSRAADEARTVDFDKWLTRARAEIHLLGV